MKNRIRKITTVLTVLFVLIGIAVAYELRSLWYFPIYSTQITYQAALPAVETEQMLAGVAVRDVTTPIGFPKAGYAVYAENADGFRNRLKTKAFYIKPKKGEPVAVIQADLPMASLSLHHQVAENLAKKTDIGFHNLSIHATHTHSGPGQFLDDDILNNSASNQPGFDPDVFNFLVKQMTDAMLEAFNNRKPAKIATGNIEVWGAAKNRSIVPYVSNHNVTDKSTDDAARLRAVNPTMTMVRIDLQDSDGIYKPAGAFSTYAIHGTAIAPHTSPYHGDVWTFFEKELEWNIEKHYNPPWQPIHGPFQANHGDNNPNYNQGLRGDAETRRIGIMLGAAAWKLFKSLDSQLKDDVEIISAAREMNALTKSNVTSHSLCERPIFGAAAIGAAKGDDAFPLSYIPPFQRGWPKKVFADDCHAQKQWMMSKLQLFLSPKRYPHRLFISSIQIDDLVMVGLPFEITFESGNRIAREIESVYSTLNKSIQHVVVSSHANGFFAYSTTKEEYQKQWYEGGQTLYGPGTTEFLSTESARIVKDMVNSPGFSDLPDSWTFERREARFFPEKTYSTGKREEISKPAFHDANGLQEPHWRFQYIDVSPANIVLHEPLLSVETKSLQEQKWQPFMRDGIVENDQGYDLQIIHLEDKGDGMSLYELRWYYPPIARDDQEFRFKVAEREGQAEFYSPGF